MNAGIEELLTLECFVVAGFFMAHPPIRNSTTEKGEPGLPSPKTNMAPQFELGSL